MGCGGSRSGGSLAGNTIQPCRGVSFQGSGFLSADVEMRDKKDPDARRAKLMERQKKAAKLYKSQSWAAPGATTTLDGGKGMTPQQLRDRATKRGAGAGKGLSQSWSAPANGKTGPVTSNKGRLKQRGVLALDLPVDNCDGSFGNFWGSSPHSPQGRHSLHLEEQMNLAHVGAAHAPLSPVAIINAKKAAKHLAAKAHRHTAERKQLSEAEKRARKKAKRDKEKAFMAAMVEGEDETAAAGDGAEDSQVSKSPAQGRATPGRGG